MDGNSGDYGDAPTQASCSGSGGDATGAETADAVGIHTILGFAGSGKTQLAKHIVGQSRRLVVIDTLAEHGGWLPEMASPQQFREALLSSDPDNSLRISYVPSDLVDFEWAVAAVVARRNIAIYVDEIDHWYANSQARPCDAILDVARYGRHYQQGFVAIARNASAVHVSYRSQGTLWVFPIREPRDAKYITEATGGRLNPQELNVAQRQSDGRVLVTEVARVSPHDMQICEFNVIERRLTNGRQIGMGT